MENRKRSLLIQERHSDLDKLTSLEASWRVQLLNNAVHDIPGYLSFVLEKVSRTFAVNIQVLPQPLKHSVLLAYLFCRIADTLEDDPFLEPERKIFLLNNFKDLFPVTQETLKKIDLFVKQLPPLWSEANQWDLLLSYHCQWVFEQALKETPASMQIMTRWISEMVEGMALFTERLHGNEDQQSKGPLIETVEDLDRYCYYVAGTVGNLLCDLFSLHSRYISGEREEGMRKLSVSFGLGLQLTNILKDVDEDATRNIFFLPEELLRQVNITRNDFGKEAHQKASREVQRVLLKKTLQHLRDALDYSCLIPRRDARIRLFCLWPLFMALETLSLLANWNYGKQAKQIKIKISRADVTRIVRQTSLVFWSNLVLRQMFNRVAKPLEALLEHS